MSYLLDTDIASAFLKGHRAVFNRFIQHSGGLFISSVGVSELYVWAFRKSAPAKRLEVLEEMLKDVALISLDHDIARVAGELQAGLLDRGTPMPGMDLLIAATAVANNLTLATHNAKHYQSVPGLRIEDWL